MFQSAKCWWMRVIGFAGTVRPKWAQKGPDTRAKCVVTMSPTRRANRGQLSWDQIWSPGPSEDLRKGPFGAAHGKNGKDGLEANEISVIPPSGFSGFLHKRPGRVVSPSGLRRFLAVSGPNRVFASKTQQLYEKRVTWVHSAQPLHRSFWVRCVADFLGVLGPCYGPR